MARLRGFWSFLGYAAGLFLALRLLHVALPLVRPDLQRGPFRVERFDEVQAHLGFSPWIPYYRPEKLGIRPVAITVTRQPYPRVVIAWEGARFLRLVQQQGGPHVASVRGQAIPGHADALWWADGDRLRASLREGEVWIDVESDLSAEDFHRVVDTLRPYKDLR